MKNILVITILSLIALIANANDKTITQIIQVSVTEKGFEPDKINVKPGTYVILKVTRKTESTCATEIKISEMKLKKDLPLNKEVSIDVGIIKKGKIKYACGMNMITGFLIVE